MTRKLALISDLAIDLDRFPIVSLGFVPSLGLVKHDAKLLPDDRLHGTLVDPLKDGKRRLVAHQRLVEPAFRQREGAELTAIHALSPKVV